MKEYSLQTEPAIQKSPGLHFAFDIGHSSIGWAALDDGHTTPNVLGCGAVVFAANDCLASTRRTFRRQRRHIRSTRRRIERIEKLLLHTGALSADTIAKKHTQDGGHSAPWLLAARVLASKGDPAYLLDWPQLWDVLRWYAHNRGYDGNERWSTQAGHDFDELDEAALDMLAQDASLTEDEKKDVQKVKRAKEIMREETHTSTMAETFCAISNIEIFGTKISTHFEDPTKRPKARGAAFPRKIVVDEVRRILEAHTTKLPACDARFIHLLMARDLSPQDRATLLAADIRLPQRYQGGLLFGQLVPRFDNRILTDCPFTGEKVPGKNNTDFLDFRWALTVANIRIALPGEPALRPLTAIERRKVDAAARRLGFLKLDPDKPGKDGVIRRGKNELRDIVCAETGCDRHDLDSLLLHPDIKESLKILWQLTIDAKCRNQSSLADCRF